MDHIYCFSPQEVNFRFGTFDAFESLGHKAKTSLGIFRNLLEQRYGSDRIYVSHDIFISSILTVEKDEEDTRPINELYLERLENILIGFENDSRKNRIREIISLYGEEIKEKLPNHASLILRFRTDISGKYLTSQSYPEEFNTVDGLMKCINFKRLFSLKPGPVKSALYESEEFKIELQTPNPLSLTWFADSSYEKSL